MICSGMKASTGRLVSSVPVAPTIGTLALAQCGADSHHHLGAQPVGLAVVALVAVNLVAGEDGAPVANALARNTCLVATLAALDHRRNQPRLHRLGVIGQEVDVSDRQVGEVRRATVEVSQAQVGEAGSEV